MATKLRFIILALILLTFLPISASASHNADLEVNKPLGFYSRGAPVTFTVTNNGNDNAIVNCWGIVAYQRDPNPGAVPQVHNDVAYEAMFPGNCPDSGGAIIFPSHQLAPGQSYQWIWDQKYRTDGVFKAANGNQVLDGTYFAKIKTWQFTGNQWIAFYPKSSDFFIEQDLDGDGIVDSQDIDMDGDGINNSKDKCPDEDSRGDDVNKNGCKDTSGDNDGDGLSNDLDACPDRSAEGATTAGGCPDKDGDGVRDYNNQGAKVDQCPDEKEDKNGYRDEDGCADYWEEIGTKAGSGTASVGVALGAFLASAGEVAKSVFEDSPTFLGALEVSGGVLAGELFNWAKDPPDTETWGVVYVPKQPSNFWLKSVSQLDSEEQMLIITMRESSSNLDALTKSKERYDGALLAKDYVAAHAQAKAVRLYARLAAQSFSKLSSELLKAVNRGDFDFVSREEQIKFAKDFRQRLIINGVAGFPKTELSLAKAEGEEESLQLMHDFITNSLNDSAIDELKPMAEYFKESAKNFKVLAISFDELSKTFGANVYIRSSQNNDGTTSLGVYYQNVPNEVNKFAIEIEKPKTANLEEINAGDAVNDWAMNADTFAQSNLIIAGFAEDADNNIKTGSRGLLFELRFKNTDLLEKPDYKIISTDFDMFGWLSVLDLSKADQSDTAEILLIIATIFIILFVSPMLRRIYRFF